MNDSQRDILDFLRTYPHDYAPTVREIAAAVGIKSSSTVHHKLKDLERLGYIERRPYCPRCITVKTPGK